MKSKKSFTRLLRITNQRLYILAGLVFLAALFLLVWLVWPWLRPATFFYGQETGELKFSPTCEWYRQLDGVCVESEKEINPRLIAVMIENHPAARPPSGLAQARVVYEAPVEANYTRFLAIYLANQLVPEVGPVRSARPYFLDWVAEYGSPLYLHVGGSADALARIAKEKVLDVNEFFYGQYFWRSKDRLAPHNVYTNSENWLKLLEKIEYTSDQYQGWAFATTTGYQPPTVNEIVVSFLPPTYEATWKYNTSTLKYDRYQDDQLHRDADKQKITADTVIVQKVKSQVLDSVGRLGLATISEGEAFVFRQGQITIGQWRKDSLTNRTRFFDTNNSEILLQPGKIWLEILPQDGHLTYN
ncbi:MAG TPA: DUF3048 domain-containing protein [Patescibacteria group bacterium]|nr:DUF3048 domain-containing protein [Patescibacteria group bacterium]